MNDLGLHKLANEYEHNGFQENRGENKVPLLRSQSGPYPLEFRGPHQNLRALVLETSNIFSFTMF